MESHEFESKDGDKRAMLASDPRPGSIYRKVFECLSDAAFVIDPGSDEIIDVNTTACRMLGYEYSELLSLPISRIHPHDMPALRAFADSVYEEGRGWTDRFTCSTKSGIRLQAEVSAVPMPYDGRRYVIALAHEVMGGGRSGLTGEAPRGRPSTTDLTPRVTPDVVSADTGTWLTGLVMDVLDPYVQTDGTAGE